MSTETRIRNQLLHPLAYRVLDDQPQRIGQALAVLEEQLGAGYGGRGALEALVADHDQLCLVCLEGETIIGVVTAASHAGMEEFLGSQPADMREALAQAIAAGEASRVGLIKSVAVDPAHQGRGVATALVGRAVQRLRSGGATQIVSLGWTDQDGCHIGGVLQARHFKARTDIQDYWMNDSIEHRYSCPTCGAVCRCTARVFSRTDLHTA